MNPTGAIELLMLVAVIVLAVLAGLLLGVVLRRRARAARGDGDGAPVKVTHAAAGRPASSRRLPTLPPPTPAAAATVRRVRSARPTTPHLGTATTAPAGSAPSSGLAGAVTVGTSDRVCPTCKAVYQDMIYCQRDARRLVTLDELGAPGRAGGLACPRCGRSYEHGLRRCPHDGGELVPLAMYHATRRRRDSSPTGVMAKVCPVCRRRFDLSSRFCGRDGHELVVIN